MPRGRPKKIKEEEPQDFPELTQQGKSVLVMEDKLSKYDEYGVCISCKGGKEGCLHNNLVYVGRNLICSTCGYKVK